MKWETPRYTLSRFTFWLSSDDVYLQQLNMQKAHSN
jgi:hypothetical protein